MWIPIREKDGQTRWRSIRDVTGSNVVEGDDCGLAVADGGKLRVSRNNMNIAKGRPLSLQVPLHLLLLLATSAAQFASFGEVIKGKLKSLLSYLLLIEV